MKNKSIKKNFIYNTILTSANIVFPLITAPYLSHTLGAENIGKVNYATAIVNWFILISAFGIPRYGIREIARNRDDRKELSNTFWNLILIQVGLSIIAILLYLLIIFNVHRFESELNIHLMMVLMLVLNVFSIDWFYQGIEEYSYITIRNIAFKIISILLMFFMIKNSDDYIIYAGINIFGLCFNNILNYLNTKKYIDKKVYEFKILYYLKELRIYFLTTLITALYTQLDQLFIGYRSEQDLAFYLRSKTVLGVGISITNSLVTVLIPRTAYLYKNNYNEYKSIIQKSINYIYIIAIPCMIGIFLLSEEIMTLLGGIEFLPASKSLKIISVLLLVSSIAVWQINQILLPHKQEKLAFIMQLSAAILSIILNSIIIPKYSYIGASITWVITEGFIVIVANVLINIKCYEVKIKYFNRSLLNYLISAFIMSLSILYIKYEIENYILRIVISIIIAPIIYFGIIILLKDKLVKDIKFKVNTKYKKKEYTN